MELFAVLIIIAYAIIFIAQPFPSCLHINKTNVSNQYLFDYDLPKIHLLIMVIAFRFVLHQSHDLILLFH